MPISMRMAKASTVLAAILVLASMGYVAPEPDNNLESVKGMLQMVDITNAVLQTVVASSQLSNYARDSTNGSSVGNSASRRMMLAVNSTVKTNIQKVSSRVSLLSSDAFAISYTAFKSARAAILLLQGYLKASATGTITVDNMSLLDFAASVAALNGELSDLLSRISKLNADAVAPLGLVKG